MLAAVEQAMDVVKDAGLDIVILEDRHISPGIRGIVDRYGR